MKKEVRKKLEKLCNLYNYKNRKYHIIINNYDDYSYQLYIISDNKKFYFDMFLSEEEIKTYCKNKMYNYRYTNINNLKREYKNDLDFLYLLDICNLKNL